MRLLQTTGKIQIDIFSLYCVNELTKRLKTRRFWPFSFLTFFIENGMILEHTQQYNRGEYNGGFQSSGNQAEHL